MSGPPLHTWQGSAVLAWTARSHDQICVMPWLALPGFLNQSWSSFRPGSWGRGRVSFPWGSWVLWEKGVCLSQMKLPFRRNMGMEVADSFGNTKLALPWRNRGFQGDSGCGKQTFQAKGIAWAKPFFANIAYKIEGILIICTFYCMNKELKEQKETNEMPNGLALPFLLPLLWRWDGGWMWLVSLRAPSLLCTSQQSEPSKIISFIFYSFWLIIL